jgi:ATP-dependent RNA helicase SUPV3L1/SUV3
LETTARLTKKQRRQQIKQELLAWLAQQPNRRVLEADFEAKVGLLSDVHALFASRDFIVFKIRGQRWVTAPALRDTEFKTERTEPPQEKKQQQHILTESVLLWLAGRPDQRATKEEFRQQFGMGSDADAVLTDDAFVTFDDQGKRWLQPREYHDTVFQKNLAREKRVKNDLAWQECIPFCGEVMRPDGTHGKSARLYVIARTYTPEAAAKQLGLANGVLRAAAASGDIPSFTDPDGRTRIPAAALEQASQDEEFLETILGNTRLKTNQITIVSGIPHTVLRSRLRKAHISITEPFWKQVRGLWGMPNHLKEFNALLEERYPIWLEAVGDDPSMLSGLPQTEFERTRAQARAEANRLRQQLIEAFPTWDRDRAQQHITLHMGPTNSGKTFSGLNNLAAAGSGWYLSPLRLLAHEVFDSLNKRGVLCNLLTGEEAIEVPGAQITAATIEMFNPRSSGECIIIDEAHMLADDQRGWAWTRAIMEADAPDIHIVGSPVSEMLINRLAEELGFTVTTERYERLTPLQVAERPWTLEDLPPRTILVAFSRKTVLGLKADLEKKFNRSVAVVYGNLPPEVRLRQAERFANGEAEICVATDAIGMGLNLPADNVCFYEVEKFDGKNMRVLNPNEVKQIAGRAGRFGLSERGMVGALSKFNLHVIRQAIEAQNTSIGFAYVAPTPESLALLPGALEDKLRQWMTLNGIPERWRRLLKPVDLSEQITLAGMLSPANVRKLGEETALQLISAPCANNTEPYWLSCTRAIIARQDMPVPDDDLPRKITDTESLESYELMIRCADIYLWLAQRREFSRYAPDEDMVRAERRRLSEILDDALVARIDTARRCRSCGRPLPLQHRHNICDRCFREHRFHRSAWY